MAAQPAQTTRLLIAEQDNTFRLYSYSDMRELLCIQLKDIVGSMTRIAPSPTMPDVFSMAGSLSSYIYTCNIGTMQLTCTPYPFPIQDFCYAPSGRILACATEDGTITLRDVETGTVTALRRHAASAITLRFSSTGSMLFSGGTDNVAILWYLYTVVSRQHGGIVAGSQPRRQVKHVVLEHESAVISVALSHSDLHAATGLRDGTVLIWLIVASSARCLSKIPLPGPCTSIVFCRDSIHIAASALNSIFMFHRWSAAAARHLMGSSTGTDSISSLTQVPHQHEIVATLNNGSIISFNYISKTVTKSCAQPGTQPKCVAFMAPPASANCS